MSDKRKLHRNNLIYYMRVLNRETDELLGNLVDITPEGMMLISDEPIPAKTRFDLRIHFPREIFGEKVLDFSAESLWTRPDVNPDFHDTGFRILDVPLDQILLIKKLVSEYGFSY